MKKTLHILLACAISSQTVFLIAAADEKVYVRSVDNVTFEAGKYYAITANLTESTSSLLVYNESELKAAVQTNNANILFANDITITGLLEIKDNKTVTINMGGYRLDRGCKFRSSQVIVVRTGSHRAMHASWIYRRDLSLSRSLS